MPSAGHSASSSISNSQLFIDALVEYTKITGIVLSKNPFVNMLELSNSPQGILQLFQDRLKAFKVDQAGTQRLTDCLGSTVSVLQTFSGILDGIGGLVPIPPVNALFVAIDVLLATASGVSSSYATLLELFECLGRFLKCLGIITTIPPSSIMVDIVTKIVVELLMVLSLAIKQLKDGRFKKFAKKLWEESEIEAILHRLNRLTPDEARITVAQTLSVVYGLVCNVVVVMEDGNASLDSIWNDLVSLHQILDEKNKIKRIKRDQLLRDIQHWLSPPYPSTDDNTTYNTRHKVTAKWFFEGSVFKKWKVSGSLLCIYGKPGSGKSTLISAIIQDIKRMNAAGLAQMACYNYVFSDVRKQDYYGLLSSLVSQLAAESDSYCDILSYLYPDTSHGTRKPNIDALKKCMTDMLSLSGQNPIYIIIDALDECRKGSGMPTAREEVLGLIEDLVNLELSNVHLCVASRPEMDILTVLKPLESHSISLDEYGAQMKDIQDYVTHVVRTDPKFRRWRDADKQLVIDVLPRKSTGMFHLVFRWLEWLRQALPQRIRHLLADLPETLDEIYEDMLRGIDKAKRVYARRLFQCLTVSVRPLRVEEIAEIFAICFDEAPISTFNPNWRPENLKEAILSTCAGLITIVDEEDHQLVQFSHFSVKEFLTSDRLADSKRSLSYYHILLEPAHTTLTHACLSVLLRLDDMIDRNTISHFPLALYAAQHWVDHARFENVSSHVQEAMTRLFDPAYPHFMAWVWLYDIDRHWIEPMSTIHPTRPDADELYYASLCGFRGLVAFLIAADSLDVNGRGGSHTTSLHAASAKGHLEVISLLLKCGADPNSWDNQRKAPLHWASQGGHLGIAQLLLDWGCDVNIRDAQRWTPLHYSLRFGHSDLAWLIIERGAAVSAPDDNGWTPLHAASFFGHLRIARLLQGRGIDVDVRNKSEETPLYMSSSSGKPGLVSFLIEHGADIHVRDKKGWNPVHISSYHGHLDVVRLLIDAGTPIDILNGTQNTPLALASRAGKVEVGRFLIGGGADLNTLDEQGRAPLHFAAHYGHPDMVRLLIEHGVDVNVQKFNLWTPLHLASAHGHLTVVQLLVLLGARVDMFNGKEETSLFLAAGNGRVEISRFLIDNGANCHTTNSNGWTPLHAASRRGHLGVVELLIQGGANVDMLNKANKTAAELASENGQARIAKLIAEYKVAGNGGNKDEEAAIPRKGGKLTF